MQGRKIEIFFITIDGFFIPVNRLINYVFTKESKINSLNLSLLKKKDIGYSKCLLHCEAGE